jgi:hypothetical protein
MVIAAQMKRLNIKETYSNERLRQNSMDKKNLLTLKKPETPIKKKFHTSPIIKEDAQSSPSSENALEDQNNIQQNTIYT